MTGAEMDKKLTEEEIQRLNDEAEYWAKINDYNTQTYTQSKLEDFKFEDFEEQDESTKTT